MRWSERIWRLHLKEGNGSGLEKWRQVILEAGENIKES